MDESVVGFAPGTAIIVQTEEGIEAGVLISYGDSGDILYKTTHILEGVVTTSRDKELLRGSIEGCSVAKLRRYAREGGVGFVKSLRMDREELVERVYRDEVWEHDEVVSGARHFKPLSRPITVHLGIGQWTKLMSLSEFLEERALNPLDFEIVE